jgi:hypothetical protein
MALMKQPKENNKMGNRRDYCDEVGLTAGALAAKYLPGTWKAASPLVGYAAKKICSGETPKWQEFQMSEKSRRAMLDVMKARYVDPRYDRWK